FACIRRATLQGQHELVEAVARPFAVGRDAGPGRGRAGDGDACLQRPYPARRLLAPGLWDQDAGHRRPLRDPPDARPGPRGSQAAPPVVQWPGRGQGRPPGGLRDALAEAGRRPWVLRRALGLAGRDVQGPGFRRRAADHASTGRRGQPPGRRPHLGRIPALKVLITGANGFLGQRVVAEFLRRGHAVRALVRPAAKVDRLGWPDEIEVFRADLRAPRDLVSAFEGVDAVVHLAAGVKGSEDAQFAASVVGTERLLDAMARSKTKRLVLASSFSV